MSKNVFSDLGFSEEEAAGLKLKSYLFMSLQEAIKLSGKKQTDIAALIGSDQAKVSKILNGKLDEFSIERITEFMQKLGYDIHIGTCRAPADRQATVVMDKREMADAR
ncbi:MAG: XRE family transcriptional regulator [Candidatus Obscuribacter sp.]|jgi:predicted XRE-type DNA-binding protein|nr:XRE family transcriptional regulator [Candidatus Obscuribacter sp.]MBP6349764.1 XRE family transcriptional regulator [Candidatus Obscuribacter sp.]MBP6594319.1 XRE family transcriptional regulator [Candidatus Obscuribacter sp.]MBP7576204.1 XRE family transcriptional regulator [Candidatus Obscuribacter sp.]